MEKKKLLNRKILGVETKNYLLIFCFYTIFAFSYHLTLWVNRLHQEPSIWELFNIGYFAEAAGLNYFIKLIFSIPIWWLIFRKFKDLPLAHRLMIHIITMPLFIVATLFVHYKSAEYFGFYHLESYGIVWDIYIPFLFYVLQFGILHAYEYYHTNQKIMQQKAALSQAALKSELAALKAQLNPHFLYNTFNTINASLPPEQENTRVMIAKLSDLFRYQLKGTKKELVPLMDEIDFVKTYLELEHERFQERLTYEINISPEAKAKMIPPMILQPIVENAVKHGIAPKIEGGKIVIDIKTHNNHLIFNIIDNGIGLNDQNKGEGIGLANTKLRLEKLYGEALHIRNHQDAGVQVDFRIPIQTAA